MHPLIRNLSQRAFACFLSLSLAVIALPNAANGATKDPLVDALTEIEQVDGKGRWFSYSIALVGSAAGIGMGGWALYARPLAEGHRPDPVVFGSAALVMGSAITQILHGGGRFDERGNSARHARRLLGDSALRDASGRLFLEYRAGEAWSTRYWGAVMTTAQGLGTTALGGRLWAEGEGGVKTTGIVLTVLGALNIGVGAVHFFGKPRSQRILDRTIEAQSAASETRIVPTMFPSTSGQLVTGLAATGEF